MSKSFETMITCPNCGEPHPFTIWQSINTVLDPEMKQAVRDMSAFLFTCPSCGDWNLVDYGFLYHQMEDRIMIHCANSGESAEEIYKLLTEGSLKNLPGAFPPPGYLTRIVRSQNELLEKLAVFDAGLDDRVMEICKLYINAYILDELPKGADVDLYYCTDNGQHLVQIVVDGKPFGTVPVSRKLYDAVAEDYEPYLKEIREEGPFVDSQWAFAMFEKRKMKTVEG